MPAGCCEQKCSQPSSSSPDTDSLLLLRAASDLYSHVMSPASFVMQQETFFKFSKRLLPREMSKWNRVSPRCLPRSRRGGRGQFGCPMKPCANSACAGGPWVCENSRLCWFGSRYVDVRLFSVWARYGSVVCSGDAVRGW